MLNAQVTYTPPVSHSAPAPFPSHLKYYTKCVYYRRVLFWGCLFVNGRQDMSMLNTDDKLHHRALLRAAAHRLLGVTVTHFSCHSVKNQQYGRECDTDLNV